MAKTFVIHGKTFIISYLKPTASLDSLFHHLNWLNENWHISGLQSSIQIGMVHYPFAANSSYTSQNWDGTKHWVDSIQVMAHYGMFIAMSTSTMSKTFKKLLTNHIVAVSIENPQHQGRSNYWKQANLLLYGLSQYLISYNVIMTNAGCQFGYQQDELYTSLTTTNR